MRTTLKRGIGRGAAANGNGRAVLPPGTLSTISRYRQPPPPRPSAWRLAGRFVLWLLAAFGSLIVSLLGGYYLFLHESIAAVAPHSRDVKAAQLKLDAVPLPGHATNALVIGYDHRAGEPGSDPSRSDTIMLIRADPTNKTISLLSLPRDLNVPIYCRGNYPSYPDRINAAYACGGSTATLETVKHLTGLNINYLIAVNFHGFRQIVDKLGGVWIDVDRRYFNRNVGTIDTAFSNID